ncbi:MAG: bifunctional isocitrate dehydrogenase kinase/phosphatase [Rhodanobacter sp.]|nr:MAG: bifunctional isocitrate dehydrogenase kinase/phosphatase [Rhodanobacter sp.]
MTGTSPSRDPQAHAAAALILDGFVDYNARFSDITRRARRRFERREWKLVRRDADARIDLYDECIGETLARLDILLDDRIRSRPLWATMRQRYEGLLATLADRELYKTWFNSLSRRRFRTHGVVADIEFVALDRAPYTEPSDAAPHRRYAVDEGTLSGICRRLLADYAHAAAYADLSGCAARLATALWRCQGAEDRGAIEELHVLETVFYRERRAYLVGRLRSGGRRYPLVVALVHEPAGVRVDALIASMDQVSILFGYARSYFHADIANVGAAVAFLHALLPHKPLEELYTVLGRARQGKTERYRRVFGHLAIHPQERLVRADGKRGMVMEVFTLRDLPVVFKVIRDRFAWPKDTERHLVEAKYRLVFHHDRVGRLVDAQEFRQLRFPLRQVDPTLRHELLESCADSVRVEDDDLVVAHCYVEHRLRPMDLYVREVGTDEACRAMRDYGQAVKDLAGSNIFPGDLLLKNFGISRNGRAVFYDYDELCTLGECRFRALPPMHEDDEMRPLQDEVYAAPEDIFPELFIKFLGVPAPLREALREVHGEIFDPHWWQALQARLRAGDYVDVPPYPASATLPVPPP